MKTFSLQSSFNNGVLDSLVAARLDIKQYYQGMTVGENVVCLPQGGVKRRPGLEYIDEVAGDGRVVPFVFNTDQSYVCVFTDNKVEIYRSETDTLVDTVVTPYALADLPELDFAQSADTMIIVHEDYQPRTLVRGATDADFTLSTITFTYTPQHDFNDSSSPTAVSEIQRIEFNANWLDGDTFVINLDRLDTEVSTFSDDATAAGQTAMEDAIQEALLDLPNTGNDGVSVGYVSTGDIYDVTLSGASADNWPLMTVRAKETANSNTRTVSVTRQQVGAPRKEDVWSSTRGWPRTVTFFEGRLWFGGSAQRPNTIWGSRVNNFYNFDPGKSRADDAINITLDTDQINRIQALYAGRALQIFTIGGEHVFKTSATEPITPENVAIIPQTAYGAKRIKPVAVGGVTMFVQKTGKVVREFIYSDTEQAYDATPITLLAPNIISDPVDISVQRGSSATDATFVYLTNDDGTISVFNSARNENVSAWSTWTTEGEFKSSTVVLESFYTLVERTIDGADKYYLEKANYDFYTDSGVQFGATASLTNLDHLDSEVCSVVMDGYRVLPDETVPSSAPFTVTLPVTPTSSEIGLGFDVTIETMPVTQDPGNGYNLRRKLRVSRMTLVLEDALGVKVDGYKLKDDHIDGEYTPFTGTKSITLMGWEKRPTKTITQTDPLPMTIVGINMEVNG